MLPLCCVLGLCSTFSCLLFNVAAMNISIHVSLGLVPLGGISGIKVHEELWTLIIISHHSSVPMELDITAGFSILPNSA